MKSPIGKYFKTRYDQYYCFEAHGIFPGYNLICVSKKMVMVCFIKSPNNFPKSTRKAFMKAYNKTLEKLNEIVGGV